MNEQMFKNNFAGLCEYFDKKVTTQLAVIYWNKLNHLSDDDFLAVVDRCVSELEFFPKIPKILAFIPKKPKILIMGGGAVIGCENTHRLMLKYPPNF